MKLKKFLKNFNKTYNTGIVISLIDEKNKPKLAAKRWLKGWAWDKFPPEDIVQDAENLFQDDTPPYSNNPKAFRIFVNEVARITGVMGTKGAKKEIEQIRNTAIKLPKKSFKLKEEWADSFKTYSRSQPKDITTEIFKNPTKKEMDTVGEKIGTRKTLRYIADNSTKIVYVFSPQTMHYAVAKRLKVNPKDNTFFQNSNVLGGVAVKEGGGWKTTEAHNITMSNIENKEKILKKDWKWMEKYIEVYTYLKGVVKK